MKFLTYLGLILCVTGIACGQVLFKLAAKSSQSSTSLLAALLSPYLLIGIALYGTMTLAWIWLLTKLELSRAYPFMALSFVFVPLLCVLVLGEHISARYWIGMALIICGLLITLSATSH
ncbi:EamA family transporter [Dyella flava]|uniref:EamA family transporter n=1 Tax=Dyella flava TaxID=1920170 RepID=A0ABS2K9F9_9GAMM|nr:EamA family transporter [Dyella flava]MBM7127483.1 EamA family transporter [Dyella flava]